MAGNGHFFRRHPKACPVLHELCTTAAALAGRAVFTYRATALSGNTDIYRQNAARLRTRIRHMPMLLGFRGLHAKLSLYSLVGGVLMWVAPGFASAQAARAAIAAAPTVAQAPPSSVILELATRYNAERYMGLWYKVGKTEIPSNELRTRERYEMLLRYDGAVRVIYTYYLPLSNQWKRTEDYMEPLDKSGNTFPSGHRIEPPITFRINRFGNLLSVDYRTFAIDANYQWALVKGPGAGSYFVLARSPSLQEPLRRALTQLAKRNYPDMGNLVWSSLESEK